MKRSYFSPYASLEGKSNYKRYYLILPDGSCVERILLNVPQTELRESIVFEHFKQHLERTFTNVSLEDFKLLTRNKPWDFRLVSKEGEEVNIEITSIAENSFQFEKFKREEYIDSLRTEPLIRKRELNKTNRWFNKGPTERSRSKEPNLDEMVKNPYYQSGPSIYTSSMKSDLKPLSDLILDAIQSKQNKKNKGKKRTILIIDNRTIRFEIKDYFEASEMLELDIEKISFPEIVFYNGYFSDNDGSNADFSFSYLKTTENKTIQLERIANHPDSEFLHDGIVLV